MKSLQPTIFLYHIYRETAEGGLAKLYKQEMKPNAMQLP